MGSRTRQVENSRCAYGETIGTGTTPGARRAYGRSLSRGPTFLNRADGAFEYFGEGQVGDMQLQRGNRAIVEHSALGKEFAIRALVAQIWFATQKPTDMPDLPLNVREDSPGSFKWQSPRHYL